ncbi:hypothetical protein ACD661_08830 [Legionella lytica]|uniref:Uncharacterized protein n=1 Tax=Legionella lytica TaxID=96232 RepID=A0ABW8D7G2_9GAMM
MKKLVVFCFMLLWSVCWGTDMSMSSCHDHHQQVSLAFKQNGIQSIELTAYKGEKKIIPMTMVYSYLHGSKLWSLSSPVSVENLGSTCPSLPYDLGCKPIRNAICDINLILDTKALNIGQRYSAHFNFVTYHKKHMDPHVYAMQYAVTIIRRPLSMKVIAPQTAKVGVEFEYPLRNAVNNYQESVDSKAPVSLVMSVEDIKKLNNLGLSFDPKDFSFKGTPNKPGSFKFQVGAANGYSATQSLAEMIINVQYNKEYKPSFKANAPIPNATSKQNYQLNLMTLLENTPGFNTTNQVRFKIDDNSKVPSGLALSAANNLLLEGEPNPALAGDTIVLTVIATSNTGGDSDPHKLRISVDYDSSKRPSIEPFVMERRAGAHFYVDLSQYLNDPAQDLSLAIIIDQVEPNLEDTNNDAFKIEVSAQNPKMLEGYIPENAVGKKYYITLHANTHTGGDSEKLRIPLQVSINKSLTPKFRQNNPQLPLVLPGQPFTHDFAANRDVWPEYEDVPYEINFAEGYTPPPWLKLEDNKLFSEANVPMATKDIEVILVIKNTPGGVSNPITLSLTVP